VITGSNNERRIENNMRHSLSFNKLLYLTVNWKVRLGHVWMLQYLDVSGVAVASSDMWSYGDLQIPLHFSSLSNTALIWHPCKQMVAQCTTLQPERNLSFILSVKREELQSTDLYSTHIYRSNVVQ
jgi:hypothetical protein